MSNAPWFRSKPEQGNVINSENHIRVNDSKTWYLYAYISKSKDTCDVPNQIPREQEEDLKTALVHTLPEVLYCHEARTARTCPLVSSTPANSIEKYEILVS